MYVFYFFAVVVVGLGILSLRSGFRFSDYVNRELARANPPFTPFVSIVAPCKGIDPGLRENLTELLRQDFPAYEVVFVVESESDPATEVLEDLRRSAYSSVRIVVAGLAEDAGQKVHNLRVATETLNPKTVVIAFVDSDVRVGTDWLRNLVAPLIDPKIGATTGYRWFVPHGGFASHLRSVWNASIASALGAQAEKNFVWGGSTAIKKLKFDELHLRERWKGTVSDDFALTRVLQEAKQPIHFVPQCLVPSFEDCSAAELIEFTNRQLKITRVYAPQLWKPLLIGSLLFVAIFFSGLAILLVQVFRGNPSWMVGLLVATIIVLGATKSLLRLRVVRKAMNRESAGFDVEMLAHLTLWPIASALYLMNAIIAAFSRRIEWRGITYELKSPDQAVIIGRKKVLSPES